MGIGSMLAPGTARTRAPNSSSAIVSNSQIYLYQAHKVAHNWLFLGIPLNSYYSVLVFYKISATHHFCS